MRFSFHNFIFLVFPFLQSNVLKPVELLIVLVKRGTDIQLV